MNIPFIIQYGHVYNKPTQFIKMQLNDLSLYLLNKPYQLFTLTYNAYKLTQCLCVLIVKKVVGVEKK